MAFERLAKMGYIEGFIWAFIISCIIWLIALFFALTGMIIPDAEWFYSITGLLALWFTLCCAIAFTLFDLKQAQKQEKK